MTITYSQQQLNDVAANPIWTHTASAVPPYSVPVLIYVVALDYMTVAKRAQNDSRSDTDFYHWLGVEPAQTVYQSRDILVWRTIPFIDGSMWGQ